MYALLIAVTERSARPIAALATMGALGVALSAPKLLPLLDGFGKAPRLIESTEVLEPGALFALLTSRDQGFGSRPGRVWPYGWHEWGMYISAAGALPHRTPLIEDRPRPLLGGRRPTNPGGGTHEAP